MARWWWLVFLVGACAREGDDTSDDGVGALVVEVLEPAPGSAVRGTLELTLDVTAPDGADVVRLALSEAGVVEATAEWGAAPLRYRPDGLARTLDLELRAQALAGDESLDTWTGSVSYDWTPGFRIVVELCTPDCVVIDDSPQVVRGDVGVRVTAADAALPVERVEITVDGAPLTVPSAPPFGALLRTDPLPDGASILTVRGFHADEVDELTIPVRRANCTVDALPDAAVHPSGVAGLTLGADGFVHTGWDGADGVLVATSSLGVRRELGRVTGRALGQIARVGTRVVVVQSATPTEDGAVLGFEGAGPPVNLAPSLRAPVAVSVGFDGALYITDETDGAGGVYRLFDGALERVVALDRPRGVRVAPGAMLVGVIRGDGSGDLQSWTLGPSGPELQGSLWTGPDLDVTSLAVRGDGLLLAGTPDGVFLVDPGGADPVQLTDRAAWQVVPSTLGVDCLEAFAIGAEGVGIVPATP